MIVFYMLHNSTKTIGAMPYRITLTHIFKHFISNTKMETYFKKVDKHYHHSNYDIKQMGNIVLKLDDPNYEWTEKPIASQPFQQMKQKMTLPLFHQMPKHPLLNHVIPRISLVVKSSIVNGLGGFIPGCTWVV